jgi:hypothetical protein
LRKTVAIMAEEDKGLWETIKPDMVKLLTVGVLGSVLSGVFGFATWVRDKRLARLEENIKNAEQIHLDATALAHERWYRGFRLLDELSQSAAPRPGHDDWLKEATRIYDDVLMRWNVADATLLSRIDMAVDSALGNSVPVSFQDRLSQCILPRLAWRRSPRARPIVCQDMAYRHAGESHLRIV